MTKLETDSPLTIINDLLPRTGLLREGWRQTAILSLNALTDYIIAHTVLKKNLNREGWVKRWLRNGFNFSSRLSAVLAFLTAYFYRNPERYGLGHDSGYLYAPADGRVVDIEEIVEPNFLNGRAMRITIASNLFQVHIQRAPSAGRIDYIFVEQNAEGWTNYVGLKNTEANGRKLLLGLTTPRQVGWKVWDFLGGQKQVSLRVTAGQEIQQNDMVGVASFGWLSLASVITPLDKNFQLLVHKGHHVKASMSVIGRYK